MLIAQNIIGTWFRYDPDQGLKKRYKITKEFIETGDYFYYDSSNVQWENIKQMKIVERRGDIIIVDDGKDYFVAYKIKASKVDDYDFTLQQAGSAKTIEELNDKITNAPSKSFELLFEIPLFTEGQTKSLESKTGINEIKREDLIALLKKRNDYTDLIQEFAKDSPQPVVKMLFYRMAKNIFQKEVIQMGYNPFIIVNGDPLKKFENDTEIQELLNNL